MTFLDQLKEAAAQRNSNAGHDNDFLAQIRAAGQSRTQAQAQPQSDVGFFEGIGASVKQTWLSSRQGGEVNRAQRLATFADSVSDNYNMRQRTSGSMPPSGGGMILSFTDTGEPIYADPMPYQEKPGAGGRIVEPMLKSMAARQKKLNAIRFSPGMEWWHAQGDDTWVTAFLDNPIEITANVVASGLTSTVPIIAQAIAGGIVAGPMGTAAGSFTGTYEMEYSMRFLEGFQEAGIDLTDPEQLLVAFQDREMIAAAREAAHKRGMTIGAFEALSGGIAGRVYKMAPPRTKAKVMAIFGEAGVQAFLEGAGEAAGSYIADGEVSSKEVFEEIIGGFGLASAQVATNLRQEIKEGFEHRRSISERSEAVESIGKLLDESGANVSAERRAEINQDIMEGRLYSSLREELETAIRAGYVEKARKRIEEFMADRARENPNESPEFSETIRGKTFTEIGKPPVEAKKEDKAPEPPTVKPPVETGVVTAQEKTGRIIESFQPSLHGQLFISELMKKLEASNPIDFAKMDVRVVDSENMPGKLRNRAAAYDRTANVIYLNKEMAANEKDGVIPALVHEVGHFAERFVIGDDFAQAQWESLSDKQREAAWEQYTGRPIRLHESFQLKYNAAARSEWVAMQFARVLRGDTEGMDANMKTRLQEFLDMVRDLVNRYIGDGKLTTQQLDAKIIEMMGWEVKEEKGGGSISGDQFQFISASEVPDAIQRLQDKLDALNDSSGPAEVNILEVREVSGRKVYRIGLPTGDEVLIYESSGVNEASSTKKKGDYYYIAGFASKVVINNALITEWFIKTMDTIAYSRGNSLSAKIAQNFNATIEKHNSESEKATAPKPETTTEEVIKKVKQRVEQEDATAEKEANIDRRIKEREILLDILGLDPDGDQAMMLSNEDLIARLNRDQSIEYHKRLNEARGPISLTNTQPQPPTPPKPEKTEAKSPEVPEIEGVTKINLNGKTEYLERKLKELDRALKQLDTIYDFAYDMMANAPERGKQIEKETDEKVAKVREAQRLINEELEKRKTEAKKPKDQAPTRFPNAHPLANQVKNALLKAIASGETLNRHDLKRMSKDMGLTEKQADEYAELGVVLAARAIIAYPDYDTQQKKFDALVRLYKAQPNLTSKTSESRINQAFSTPAPLAFVASQLAGVKDAKTVAEVTAGNGMLILERDPNAPTLVNEINATRKENLEAQGFTVLNLDATSQEFLDIFGQQAPDVQIANPPFGALKDNDGRSIKFQIKDPNGKTDFETTNIDHAIMLNNLFRMPEGSRSVFIIGSGGGKAESAAERANGYNAGTKWNVFGTLYSQFQVVEHFTIDGDLYRKQGAGWPIDVIVIDKKPGESKVLPWDQAPDYLTTWEAIGERLRSFNEQNQGSGQNAGADAGRGSAGATSGSGGPALSGGSSDGTTGGRPGRKTGTNRGDADESSRPGGNAPDRPIQGGVDQGPQRIDGPRNPDKPSLGISKEAEKALEDAFDGLLGTPEDAAYLSAVESGDMQTAQRIVDEAAKEAGYNVGPVYHGTRADPFTVFETDNIGWRGIGAYFGPKDLANEYGNASPYFIKLENPFKAPDIAPLVKQYGVDGNVYARRDLIAQGHDGIDHGNGIVAAFFPEQIKSADAVTRDDQGNIIPPSQRFDEVSNDIRYAPVEQQSLPAAKLPQFIQLAQVLIKEGIRTPEAMADLLEKKFQGKARPYTEALWDAFGMVDKSLRGTHDWDAVFAKIDAPETPVQPEVQPQVSAEPETTNIEVVETELVDDSVSIFDPIDDPNPPVKVTEFHSSYNPVSHHPVKADAITPTNLAREQRQALLRLEKEIGPLDQYVANELGYASVADLHKAMYAYQIDVVAAAIYNIKKGKAIINADMTGMGKGRPAAALIWYAIKNGMVPIFVTEKPKLYKDMLRDLDGIRRYDSVVPTFTNAGVSFEDERGKNWKADSPQSKDDEMRSIYEKGVLPPGVNAIFTTYDQLGKDVEKGFSESDREQGSRKRAGKARPDGFRMQAIRRLAHNALFIFDEVHNASGEHSDIGIRMREVRPLAKGVYYSSATFAKRPSAYAILASTDLGDIGIPPDALMDVMSRGGVGMQQFVSNMLAQSGQLFRRERSFDDITIERVVDKDNAARDEELADTYTDIFNEIYRLWKVVDEAVEREREKIRKNMKDDRPTMIRWDSGQTAATAVTGSQFNGATLYNFTNQYLLSLKADSVANAAIKMLKEGKKVVIGLYNTNESGIEALESMGLPLNFNGMAERILKKILTRTYKDISGKKVKVELTPQELGIEREYNAILDMIRSANLEGMPVSPIDHIIDKIQAAKVNGRNLKVKEITGRSAGVRNGKIYKRPSTDKSTKGQNRIIDSFNNGDTDVLVINSSGSTGISLHASETFKNQQQRVMIMAQAPSEINTFMQMLGRINRAGQVVMPAYQLFVSSLPAENRLAAMLQSKMAMLNANTTSNDSSDVSSGMKNVDYFNQYGDQIVKQFLYSNAVVRAGFYTLFPEGTLDEVQSLFEKKQQDGPGTFASYIAGWLVMLPISDQIYFNNSVVSEYTAMIDYLDSTGQNDLKAQALDYNAKTIKKEVYFEAGGNSVFTGPAFMENIEVKAKELPLTGQEALNAADKNGATVALDQLMEALQSAEERETADRLSRLKGEITEERKSATESSVRAKYMEIKGRVQTVREMIGKPYMIMDVSTNEDGSMVASQGGNTYGVVTGVAINAEFASQMARQMIVVETNSMEKRMRVPFSQLVRLTLYPGDRFNFIEDYNNSREVKTEKTVMTGNMLAGAYRLYQAFSGARTKPIVYTTESGGTKQGIELPGNINAFRRVVVESVEQFTKLLSEDRTSKLTLKNGAEFFLARDKRIVFRVPSAKDVGGRIWQAKKYYELMENGMFIGRVNSMDGIVLRENLPTLFETLRNDGFEILHEDTSERETLGTPRERTDIHRFGRRLVSDTRNPEGFAKDAKLEYRVDSLEEANALARMELERYGVDGSIRRVKDKRNDMRGQVRTMLGMLILNEMREEYRKLRSEGDLAGAKKVNDRATALADWFTSYAKDAGQAVQAFTAWQRIDAQGFLDTYIDAIDQVAIEAIDGRGLKDVVKDITVGISEANWEAAKEALENPEVVKALLRASRYRTFRLHAQERLKETFGQSQGQSVWGLYNRNAANKLAQAILNKFEGEKEKPALVEFTKRLASTLRAEIDRLTPEGQPKQKPSDLSVLLEGIQNSEKYQKVWGDVQQQVFEEYRDNPEVLEALTNFFGTILVNPYTQKTVQGVVKAELDMMMMDLNQLVRDHWGKQQDVKMAIIDRINERFPDLPDNERIGLADALTEGFNSLADKKRKAILDGIAKRHDRQVVKPIKENWQRIVELSNLGGLTRKDIYRAMAEKLNLPAYTPEVAAKITEMAEAIQMMPDGRDKQQAIIEMQSYIANQVGISKTDLFISFFYANILSGYTTQIINIMSTFLNLVGTSITEAIVNPRHFGRYLQGLTIGLGKGLLHGADMLLTGRQVGSRFNKIQLPPTFERIMFGSKNGVPLKDKTLAKVLELGVFKPLNLWKFVYRFMGAMDIMFYKTAEEARYHALAEKYHHDRGLTGKALSEAVNNDLYISPKARQEAQAKAKAEGLKEGSKAYRLRVWDLIEASRPKSWQDETREFGYHAIFVQEPKGILGMFAKNIRNMSAQWPILRLAVPFTHIVSNVTNTTLGYSPWGYKRLLFGHWGGNYGTPKPIGDAAKKQFAEATLGTMAIISMVALHLLAEGEDEDDPWFAITGQGPIGHQRRFQLQETGWRPYSIKIRGKYISYLHTPLEAAFSIAGNYLDSKRYGKMSDEDLATRTIYALQQVGNTVFSKSFLTGASDIFAVLTDETEYAGKRGLNLTTRTASGIAIPNLVKQVDRVFNSQIYQADNIWQGIQRDIPVARTELRPLVNMLGEPVNYNTNRFTSVENNDPVWQLITQKQAWISRPGRKLGDRDMTPDEYYDYTMRSGQAIRTRLEMEMWRLQSMNKEMAQERIRKIVTDERAKVRAELRRREIYGF